MDNSLTPIVRPFADNPQLMAAIKSLVIKQFEKPVSTNMSNEDLGAVTRAKLDGAQMVEKAFQEIALYRSSQDTIETVNPAR